MDLATIVARVEKVSSEEVRAAEIYLSSPQSEDDRCCKKEIVLCDLVPELRKIFALIMFAHNDWNEAVTKWWTLNTSIPQDKKHLEVLIKEQDFQFNLYKQLFLSLLHVNLLRQGHQYHEGSIGIRRGWKVVTWDSDKPRVFMVCDPQSLRSFDFLIRRGG